MSGESPGMEPSAGQGSKALSGGRSCMIVSLGGSLPVLILAVSCSLCTLALIAVAWPPPAWADVATAPVSTSAEGGTAYSEAVARGDAHWAERARGQSEGRPLGAPIDAAIEAYADAIEAEPDRLEARWKLLRALHFAGEFFEQDEEAKRRRYERATRSAESSMDWLSDRLGGSDRLDELDPAEARERIIAAGLSPDDVARLHFWTGINWGAWSQTVGLLSAVRKGVAKRLYRHTSMAARLEPGYDEGGPLRLLGSLHAQLPKVPFLTGWVDRDQALPLVSRAFEMFPDNPGNQLLLGTTLLELEPARRSEATGLLEAVAVVEPRPSMLIEDMAMERQAREQLGRLGED